MVRVAIDAMGGDYAPAEIVKGTVEALQERTQISAVLVGDEAAIRRELDKGSWPEDRITIRHASEMIEMAEPPVMAIRRKKDSSMVRGMQLVRDGEADAFISGGNSGAVMVGGQAIVGRIRGIERPPFAALMPTRKGVILALDCGANVDCRAEHLVSFARMGSIYMRDVAGIPNPRVGILNIGAEEDKGNALVKEAYPLLESCEDIRFTGSCEARDVPEGVCDVLVCDGFAGNIVLKMYEGVASALLASVKEGLMSSLRSKIGALLIKPALKGTLKTFNTDSYGGAPVLGLKGLVVKIHGNAKAIVVKNAILQCETFCEQNITEKIRTNIAEQNTKKQADEKEN
ncbi:MAG: phosphate acyltransferase PlsX [Lachnospiraceae bacterium]|nr:phosphate acyltransferase PlsX [Lachnospiraceae bacterium]